MAKSPVVPQNQPMNPGIMMVLSFLVVLLVNAVVIFVANNMFPNQVVVGNMSLSLFWAILLSAGTLSLLLTFCMPFINQLEPRMKRTWTPPELIGIYLVLNVIFLWLVTRASHIFGLGVTSWMVVVALAVVMDFLQGGAMMMVEGMRKKG